MGRTEKAGVGDSAGDCVVGPKMDHHFVQYPTPEAAFRETGGTVGEGPVVDAILSWLRRLALR